jgi:hypothetical protein
LLWFVCSGLFASAFGFVGYKFILYRERVEMERIKSKEKIQLKNLTLTDNSKENRDRLTVCIQTVMSESRQSGKALDAEKAKEICG